MFLAVPMRHLMVGLYFSLRPLSRRSETRKMSVHIEPTAPRRLSRDEIESIARRLANTMPDAPATAERVRRPATISELHAYGERYWRLVVEADDEAALLDAFARPGQYLTLQCGELEPKYLVIAEGPERVRQRRAFEFLIDQDSTLGGVLPDASVGDVVGLSPAEGPGWDVDEMTREGRLWAFTSGSGVATMRSVWRELEHQWPARLERFALFYGETERDDFVYADEQRLLAQGGAIVRRAWSERDELDPGPRFVQQALERDASVEGVHVLLSGAAPMIEAVAEHMLVMGVTPERLSLNV